MKHIGKKMSDKKRATDVNEQIAKLRSRGMLIIH